MIKKLLFILFLSLTTIGFSQHKSVEKLSAAPNPFTENTKISFKAANNATIIFSVINVLGKTVYKENIKVTTGNNSFTFKKGNLLSGIYIYKLQDKETIISKRFVIK
ncbi:Por secretion system C-terminal sorting domain-containing protein [Polaribacter sp. KT25b]|uniref:T9SS type A sorting domain-containing protein n=1 Tax=Polaribacter sp. KT25b TaxID=1855336 RepID=UPI000879ECD8|nr:T9SS type A sorting domain-containing protein [Polaribacter sp. KT25b]SDR77438.1 Por secretion system C-terminal sorting domain-containing protein [Polaribacter sp. KT25b]